MSALTPPQEEALRVLIGLWGYERVLLIGGMAIAAQTGMAWRTTLDIDLVIACSPEAALERLARLPAWTRDMHQEQRWRTAGGVLVDILAVTPEILRAGVLRWPQTGAAMSTAGIEEAGRSAATIRLSDATLLRVARLPAITLVKMVAFLDRPEERGRDLADIAWLLDGYVADDDPRRFDAKFAALDIAYDEGPAYVLGADTGSIAGASRGRVDQFLRRLEGPPALDIMAVSAPSTWRRSSARAARQLRAFRLGFEGAAS